MLGQAIHAGVGFDGGEFADMRRITGQIEAAAKADFEHLAAGAGQQRAPLFGHVRLTEHVVAETRENGL